MVPTQVLGNAHADFYFFVSDFGDGWVYLGEGTSMACLWEDFGLTSLNAVSDLHTAMKEPGPMQVLNNLVRQGICVGAYTYSSLFRKCNEMGDLTEGQKVHAHMIQSGFKPTVYVGNTLLSMYANNGSVEDAHQVFCKLVKKDVVSWTTMIGAYVKHGLVKDAFESFNQMQQEGVKPNKVTCISLLKACSSPKTLEWGKFAHVHIIEAGLESDVRVGTALINMYAKCGCSDEAFEVFSGMQQEGVKLDYITYVSILNACANQAALDRGKWVHSLVKRSGLESNVRVGTALIDMYAKCGSCKDAFEVFHHLQREGVKLDKVTYLSILNACVSATALEFGKQVHAQIRNSGFDTDISLVNALIGMYVKCECAKEAFELFHHLIQKGLEPDKITYMSILNSCASPEALELGKEVHSHAIRSKLESDVCVGNALISMYVKCRANEKALNVFQQMQEQGMEPDEITYMGILNACASPAALEWGKDIHSHVKKSRFNSAVSVGNALISMYIKCGANEEAFEVFREMQQKGVEADKITYMSILNACCSPEDLDIGKQIHAHILRSQCDAHVCVGNALISMYAKCGGHAEAFDVFHQMEQQGLAPDKITYLRILNACTSLEALEWGKEVHAHIRQSGFESDVRLGNALISMYVKCGGSKEAFDVYCQMAREGLEHDRITYLGILNAFGSPMALDWGRQVHAHIRKSRFDCDVPLKNSLIGMYVKCGCEMEAFEVYHDMQVKGVQPDRITFMNILSACSSSTLENGKKVHEHIVKSGLQDDVGVGNALISMYSKCGSNEKAFEVFHGMQREGVGLDRISYLCILKACASQTGLSEGKQIHHNITEAGLGTDTWIGNALVHMYAKCGSLKDACQVFDAMPQRDIVSWNVMITALAQHGCGKDALEVFGEMRQEGVQPNEITFIGLLSACSHAGLVTEGQRFFNSMYQDHGITPVLEHYGCMVDILGRADYLSEAEDLIKKMPFEANAAVWGALLSPCRLHGHVKLAECAAEHSLKLEPQDAAMYVLLSHIYAAAGLWDSVAKVRKIMNRRGLTKEPGLCWIDVREKAHYFVAEDRIDPQTEEIYAGLDIG